MSDTTTPDAQQSPELDASAAKKLAQENAKTAEGDSTKRVDVVATMSVRADGSPDQTSGYVVLGEKNPAQTTARPKTGS